MSTQFTNYFQPITQPHPLTGVESRSTEYRVMEDKRFDRPVKILTGRSFSVSRLVESPLKAAEYLLDDKWPNKGEKHQAALAACLAVLDGDEADVSVARKAFENAADEAGVSVKGP